MSRIYIFLVLIFLFGKHSKRLLQDLLHTLQLSNRIRRFPFCKNNSDHFLYLIHPILRILTIKRIIFTINKIALSTQLSLLQDRSVTLQIKHLFQERHRPIAKTFDVPHLVFFKHYSLDQLIKMKFPEIIVSSFLFSFFQN